MDVGYLLMVTRDHFSRINRDKRLTDEDRKCLKEFHLQNLIAPRARTLLQKYFHDDFAAPDRPGTSPQSAACSAGTYP
jgi:hypothetical protein